MMPEMNFIHDHRPVCFISLLTVNREELLTDSTDENGSLLHILAQNTW
jgi:hypothetical protein